MHYVPQQILKGYYEVHVYFG